MAKRRIINQAITSLEQAWGGTDSNGQWAYDFEQIEAFLKKIIKKK